MLCSLTVCTGFWEHRSVVVVLFFSTNIKINNQQSTSKENLSYYSRESILSAVIFFKMISWFEPQAFTIIWIKHNDKIYQMNTKYRTRRSKQAKASILPIISEERKKKKKKIRTENIYKCNRFVLCKRKV